MKITRKDFLRLTGLSFLAVGSMEAARAIAGREFVCKGFIRKSGEACRAMGNGCRFAQMPEG